MGTHGSACSLEAARPQTESGGAQALAGRLAHCSSGNVGPLLGVMIALIVLAAGAAIDVGRWMSAIVQIEKAQSAAALAGARMLQITGGDRALAISSARGTFEQNLTDSPGFQLETLTFDISPDGASFTVRTTGVTATTLLRIAGIDRLAIHEAPATATTAASLNDHRTSFEVAMAIDLSDAVSSAMLMQLKLSMTDFVDIVIGPSRSRGTSRVAVVPFSDTVDPGAGTERFTGELRPGTCDTAGCQRLSFIPRGACSAPAAACQMRTLAAGPCVSERTASEPFTDAAPDYAPVSPAYPLAARQCGGNGRVEPLTADPDGLRQSIANLAIRGSSAPHLGIAWAWYALSPEWTSLWPAASRAAPYSDLAPRTSGNRPKLRKIAILVQSARQIMQNCQGVDDRVIACASPNGSATRQTQRLCDAMHRSGISIFVIGIDIEANRDLDAVLRNSCAGREDAFYAVGSGSELRQAFRDIALQIAPVVETQ